MKPVKILYVCDPERAADCKRTNCAHNPASEYGQCSLTFESEWAKRDKNGEPMIDLLATLQALKYETLSEVPASVPYKFTASIEMNTALVTLALGLSLAAIAIVLVMLLG